MNTKKEVINIINLTVSRSKIFNEFSREEQKKYFTISGNKVIHNIDTLYYSVCLQEENEELINNMISQFKIMKDKYKNNREEIIIDELQFIPCNFAIYEYCFRLENYFDIFISSYLPNENTPRIVVQLRSIALWLEGEKKSIDLSYKKLLTFLSGFKIAIKSISENRIDYAYHTNIIQNTTQFFSDKKLVKNLKTQLEIYHKVGNIGQTIDIDYMSLGNRKSNNIFFRTYNKTKEVIEKNYKSMFIEIWYKVGLISEYDKYVYQKAYELQSWNGVLIGRIEWYIEYGKDKNIKEYLYNLKKSCHIKSDNMSQIKKCIDGLLPPVTQITNIEFQTKRKFYHTFEKSMDEFHCSVNEHHVLYRLYRILENRKIILDYLTSDTVSFRTNDKYCSWWSRIRSLKLSCISSTELIREYIRNIDKEKIKKQIINKIATNSVYKNNVNNNSFTEDIQDLISVINDNDVCLVNGFNGEFLEFHFNGYDDIKTRKNRQLKSLLKKQEVKDIGKDKQK